jgi:hypothetical protein
LLKQAKGQIEYVEFTDFTIKPHIFLPVTSGRGPEYQVDCVHAAQHLNEMKGKGGSRRDAGVEVVGRTR